MWEKSEKERKKWRKREQGDDQCIFARNVMKENLRQFSSFFFCQMPWYTTICRFSVCMAYIFAIRAQRAWAILDTRSLVCMHIAYMYTNTLRCIRRIHTLIFVYTYTKYTRLHYYKANENLICRTTFTLGTMIWQATAKHGIRGLCFTPKLLCVCFVRSFGMKGGMAHTKKERA